MSAVMTSSSNLLVVIVDASTFTWTHRSLARAAKEKALLAQGKKSSSSSSGASPSGPATLDDVVSSILVLGSGLACTSDRESALVVIVATEWEAGVVYPRKGGGVGCMDEVVGAGMGGGEIGERIDLGLLNDHVRLGVAEMVERAAMRAEVWAGRTSSSSSSSKEEKGEEEEDVVVGRRRKCAAIASALSVAMCVINRFMVTSHAGMGGVSALANMSSTMRRKDDEGILALVGKSGDRGGVASSSNRDGAGNTTTSTLSPRVLIMQASPDRTSDYNALMNCAFAAAKLEIVVDGCFVPSGTKGDDATSSPYLQQVVDRTGGVYLSVPSGAAQVGGALSEVLLTVFLPHPSVRSDMNLPILHDVDFRARCFETGESIDVARVCNQCLSIFKERPRVSCPTCGAMARGRASDAGNNDGTKKMKLK